MYTLIDKNENLRSSESRHKLLLEVDQMIHHKKVFILDKINAKSKRSSHARCEIYDDYGNLMVVLCSTMNSYPDAIRNIKRQLLHLKLNNNLK